MRGLGGGEGGLVHSSVSFAKGFGAVFIMGGEGIVLLELKQLFQGKWYL